MLSDMRDQRIFASMGALTMVAALLGDLVFLPAMLACFARRERIDSPAATRAEQPPL
jgi:hypothetical protein